MTIESEFEQKLSTKKLSDDKVIVLLRTYHKKIEDSGFAQNTRFCKMSRINMILKRLYPHLYTEALKINVPDRAEKKSAIKERTEFNMNRLENRQEFNYDKIMNAIKTLKTSQEYYKLVTCIMLATGRRNAEVIARGKFEPSKLANHVLFSGQLKTHDEQRDAYDIPVIGLTPTNLIQYFAKIRIMKNYQNETNAFIASRTNAYVNKTVRIALNRDDVTSKRKLIKQT